MKTYSIAQLMRLVSEKQWPNLPTNLQSIEAGKQLTFHDYYNLIGFNLDLFPLLQNCLWGETLNEKMDIFSRIIIPKIEATYADNTTYKSSIISVIEHLESGRTKAIPSIHISQKEYCGDISLECLWYSKALDCHTQGGGHNIISTHAYIHLDLLTNIYKKNWDKVLASFAFSKNPETDLLNHVGGGQSPIVSNTVKTFFNQSELHDAFIKSVING
tara:strand:- start:146301 stop:146948 length:648 start_codon:yes stop_codon:yes gene_type:complete